MIWVEGLFVSGLFWSGWEDGSGWQSTWVWRIKLKSSCLYNRCSPLSPCSGPCFLKTKQNINPERSFQRTESVSGVFFRAHSCPRLAQDSVSWNDFQVSCTSALSACSLNLRLLSELVLGYRVQGAGFMRLHPFLRKYGLSVML